MDEKEYIERQAVIDLLTNRDVVINANDEAAFIREDVECLPTADVRPERYAQKVKFFNDPWTGRMFTTCTACDGKVGQHDKFCKHCGAKFEEGE